MPDPLTDRLGRFTPDAAGIDRDAILFAAGRASVSPRRSWKAVAGVLALTQALTLMLLMPWPTSRQERATPEGPTPAAPRPEAAPPHTAPGRWHRRLLEEPSVLPPSADTYAPDAPPLRPLSVLHSSQLN